jgi:hypothetical protein
MSQDFFNDNAVPHGGFIANFTPGGAIKVESFNIEAPSKIINRPDEIGYPNGWAGVEDQKTATATLQIPTNAGSPLGLGGYFDAPAALGGERWVITRLGTRIAINDYWKQEVSLQKKYF